MKQQPINKPNQIIGPASVQQQQAPKLTFVTSRAPAQPVALPATKLPDLPLPNIGQLSLSSNTYSDFSPMTIDEEDFDGSDSESSAEDVVDIDYWDADDPRAVSEYVEDIYDYLRKREVRRSSRFNIPKLEQIIPTQNCWAVIDSLNARGCMQLTIHFLKLIGTSFGPLNFFRSNSSFHSDSIPCSA